MKTSIRLALPGDAERIQAIYAQYVQASVVSFEVMEPSVEEMARRIHNITQQYPWLVCSISGEIVGYAYASKHRERAAYQWSVEVSVYVDSRFQRHGIASMLYNLLFKILIDQNYYNAYAGITLPNPASVALHEKMGFNKIGVFKGIGYKLNGWHDVGWWHLPLQEKIVHPHNPIDFRIWIQQRGERVLPDYGVVVDDYRGES
jgi:L-amino acid N-acyltransferase YncA